MKNKYRTVKVVTGAVRLVNANIWSPVEVPGRGSIYTATILIPKGDSKTLLGIRTAVDSAAAAGIADLGGHRGKKPKRYLPPYDGDADGLPPVFRGCWYVNAASLTAPQILDHQLYPVADQSTVGSGSWVRVSLAFFLVYKKGGSRIGCQLGNIQKARISDSYEKIADTGFDRFLDDFLRVFEKPSQGTAKAP